MALTAKTRKEADELKKYFLIQFQIEEESEPIRHNLPKLPQQYVLVAESFLDRMSATIRTTAAPFLLANAAAHDKQYQRFSMACRIEAGSISSEPGESGEAPFVPM